MESRGGSTVRGSEKATRSYRPGTYYRVRKGDTLFSIAWRSNKDFRSLARWNGIRAPYVIYPGQLIRLRPFQAALRSPAVAQKKTRSPAAAGGKSPAPPKIRRNASGETRRPSAADKRAQRPSRTSVREPAPKNSAMREKLRWSWPTQGKIVARWKVGDPLHKGIKIAGRAGQAVRAAESGKVVYSGSGLIGYGRLIIIKHNDNYLSAYGHNRKLLANQGQLVTRGQKIAEMGKSNDGRALLHFEIRRDGKPVNPMRLLPRR